MDFFGDHGAGGGGIFSVNISEDNKCNKKHIIMINN